MNREKLLLAAGCTLFLAAASNSIATAQSGTPAAEPVASPAYKNLQVFPKSIPRPQLMENMKFFSQSLGVRCTHCHVGKEGQPLSTFDFASDDKQSKKVARAMLTMVRNINSQEFGVKDFKDVKVTCFTCHRGAVKPLTKIPPPPAPAAS